ncbi:MAG: histidine phosphatase family protein [Lachnospiraceae bacterium]|nr:histidine phosphatase family protein [Lachnospiraceae bacterium]
MLLYLIRHGETDFNKEKRYQGRRDISLSKEGIAKLRKADFEPETVYVSGLKRTSETAKVLFPGAKLRAVPGLNEMNFGVFDGRTADEMEEDPEYRKWVDNNCETRCPGGEDKEEFSKRVCKAFEEIVTECVSDGQKEAVIVSHGGTIMAILEVYATPKRDFYDWLSGNGCGFVLEYEPEAGLSSYRLVGEVQYSTDYVSMKI